MKWYKLKRLPTSHKGCLNCGPLYGLLPLEYHLGVGFGDVKIKKNEVVIWSEMSDKTQMTVADAEALAVKEPSNDWRIVIDAPLYDAIYQRQGKGKWYLVKRGQGFA